MCMTYHCPMCPTMFIMLNIYDTCIIIIIAQSTKNKGFRCTFLKCYTNGEVVTSFGGQHGWYGSYGGSFTHSLTHLPHVRWMGLKWLILSMGSLYLIGMWIDEEQRVFEGDWITSSYINNYDVPNNEHN